MAKGWEVLPCVNRLMNRIQRLKTVDNLAICIIEWYGMWVIMLKGLRVQQGHIT